MELSLSIGQASAAGHKPLNQDFHGALIPSGDALRRKGITLAIADGISPSPVSHIAAEMTVKSLLTDYYSTPETWTVRTAAARVIAATNSWLYAQGQHQGIVEVDQGHVCTLAAVIFKGHQAHVFHVGDSRVWRLTGAGLEPLTYDHRTGGGSVLARAMGAAPGVEIDYRAIDLSVGDVLLLTTDGVHDFWSSRGLPALMSSARSLDEAAQAVIAQALAAGSPDNLTVQIARIDSLPAAAAPQTDALHLPILPLPRPGDRLDGYQILQTLHASHRSHIFLARDGGGRRVVLKFPSTELQGDPAAQQRLLAEEWIARRIDHPQVMSAPPAVGLRSGLYTVTDFVEGTTLRQWLLDHPKPELDQIRRIVDQVAAGLRAFHRREMLHQDLRPENIMIDRDGRVCLIDFGSAYVAGVQEEGPQIDPGILGTCQYTAPEYFTSEQVSWRSDLFSLGVIVYEALTGRLPYGNDVSRIQTPPDRRALRYRPARSGRTAVPHWLDEALAKAVHPDPSQRHDSLTEFCDNLRRPSARYLSRGFRPLADRNPIVFWQGVSALLLVLCVLVFASRY